MSWYRCNHVTPHEGWLSDSPREQAWRNFLDKGWAVTSAPQYHTTPAYIRPAYVRHEIEEGDGHHIQRGIMSAGYCYHYYPVWLRRSWDERWDMPEKWNDKEEYWVALTITRMQSNEVPTMEAAMVYLREKLPNRTDEAIKAKLKRILGTKE
jgi:hypothetical protein